MLAKVATFAQYGVIILNLFGDKIFGYLQKPYPTWYLKMKENKWTVFIIAFLGGNMANSYLTNTGAFELYVNNKLIFSKIATGRQPSQDEILAMVEKAL